MFGVVGKTFLVRFLFSGHRMWELVDDVIICVFSFLSELGPQDGHSPCIKAEDRQKEDEAVHSSSKRSI